MASGNTSEIALISDELYDLETDPGEMQNVANLPEHRQRLLSIRQQIAEMVSHTGPGLYDWCSN